MKSSSASWADHLPRRLTIRRPQVILNAPKPGEVGSGIHMGSSHPSSCNSRSYTSPVKGPTGSILGSGGHTVSIAATSLPAFSPWRLQVHWLMAAAPQPLPVLTLPSPQVSLTRTQRIARKARPYHPGASPPLSVFSLITPFVM